MYIYSDDNLMPDVEPDIIPCLKIVVAGTDKQGAAVLPYAPHIIEIETFEMENPNLKKFSSGIDIIVNVTGWILY